MPSSWAAAASNFYVYYPERTSRAKIFALTLAGLWAACCLVDLVGVGLAAGVARAPASSGALVVAANSIPSTYSAALGCQTLGRAAERLLRWAWSSLLVLAELVLALAGREHLFLVLQNFLALMGYWVVPMVVVVLEEHALFFPRRRRLCATSSSS